LTKGAGTSSGRTPTVLVAVEKFPNRIQPWVLRGLEQTLRRGGRLWIASGSDGDESYPDKVIELGLLERTLYVRLGSVRSLWAVALGILTPGDRGAVVRRGVARIARAGALFRGSPKRIANRLIKSPVFGLSDVNVVHAHAMVSAFEYVEVARLLGASLVYTFHGLQPAGVEGLSDAKRESLFEALSVCLVNTGFAREQVVSLGCPAHKVRVVPQGIALDEFPFAPTAPRKAEPLRVLTVGRLHPDKGHAYAIEAIKLLADRGIPAEYRIVGRGPEQAHLERLADSSGVRHRVTFVGTADDEELRGEYARADVFVLPSVRDRTGHHEETQGVVLQEAQASGKIVIATRTGGIPECLDAGVSAFLVEDRSPEQIAGAIEEVVSRPERWPDWQQRSREWVEERFDADRIGARVWDIYMDLLAGEPARAR